MDTLIRSGTAAQKRSEGWDKGGCVTACWREEGGAHERVSRGSGMRRKGLCVQQLLLPEQVWVLWQLQAPVPNIGKKLQILRLTPVSSRLP